MDSPRLFRAPALDRSSQNLNARVSWLSPTLDETAKANWKTVPAIVCSHRQVHASGPKYVQVRGIRVSDERARATRTIPRFFLGPVIERGSNFEQDKRISASIPAAAVPGSSRAARNSKPNLLLLFSPLSRNRHLSHQPRVPRSLVSCYDFPQRINHAGMR